MSGEGRRGFATAPILDPKVSAMGGFQSFPDTRADGEVAP